MVVRTTFACLIAALLLLPIAALTGVGEAAAGTVRCSGSGVSISISPSPQLPGQPVTIASTYQDPASAGTYWASLCYIHDGKAVNLPPNGGAADTPVLRVTSGFKGTFTLRSDICDLVAQHGTIAVVLSGQAEGPMGGANLNPACLSLKKVPAATPTPGGAPRPL
jgi:hypothetical protein